PADDVGQHGGPGDPPDRPAERPFDDRAVVPSGRGEVGHCRAGTQPGRFSSSTTGRISTVPRRAFGIFSAIAIASSRSFASIMKYPPSCSRVSANGPSVTWRLPARTRTLVAVETGCKGLALMN